jgi:hypothetical protein
MNNLTTHKLIKIACGLCITFLFSFSHLAVASEQVTACKEHIQGKIAWDPTSNYTSASKWEDKNLEFLCMGANEPKAPGDCFHHVMTGHVSYGASDKWEYQNAMELCKGSDNADTTIKCFNKKIADKVDWHDAIAQCQARKPLENVAN